MRKNFLPFSKPTIEQKDIDSISEVLRSGWITTGPKNAEFEQLFCQYTGCKNAVALSSATAGMHVALKAMGIGPGDEIITPSMTWVSTANMIVLSGAKPVFVDVDKDTLMISSDTIQKRLTERTKLIVPVHFAGASADLQEIYQLAREENIPVLEDSAHALGTECCGDRIGKRGTAIFSFHPIKNITTGEGGMICSDDQEFVENVRRLKFHGIGMDSYDRQQKGRSPQAEVIEPGFKYNLPDLLAALGISQLSRVDDFNERRTRIAQYYLKRLEEIEEILPLKNPNYSFKHSWHLFVVRLDIDKTKVTRDEFMEKLKERNIGTGLHFRAVHLQKYYKERMPESLGRLENTEWNSARICSLPLFPQMSDADVDDVIKAIKEILK